MGTGRDRIVQGPRAFRVEVALSISWVLLTVTTGILAVPSASAQQRGAAEEDPFAGVEEMVVSGSATAALLAPQSTSAIAFDTAELDNMGVEDLSDLAAYVPNLEISNPNATNASFFVRGVGLQDFGANASSSVPIFQDSIPRNPSATQLVGLFDLGGISVLKGPQGSGNYRNSSAGAFIVQTAKPEPQFTASAKATVARIVSVDARDANRYSFESALNAPVFEDIVSARLSARYSHENPFWENGCANRVPFEDRPIQPGGNNVPSVGICGESVFRGRVSHVKEFLPRYIGEVDDYGVRGQLRVQPPGGVMDWIVRVEISNLNRDSIPGQHLGTSQSQLGGVDSSNYRDPDVTARALKLEAAIREQNPGLTAREVTALARIPLAKELRKRPLDPHPYRGDLDSPGRTILETHAVSTTGLIDLDAVDVEINFGFLDYRKSVRQDTDLSPNLRFPSSGDDQAWEYYGDMSVKGDEIGDVAIDWDTGFYTLIEKVEANLRQQVFDTDRVNQYTQEIYSWGAYAQGRYEFLEGFTLAAGLRYNWERKDFEVKDVRNGLAGPLVQGASSNQLTWDAITGFGELRYAFTEDIATYFKYTRGFKAGHFNPSRADKAEDPDGGFADPEKIDSFEWGVEAALWSGRILSTSSFFFYNYRDYQVFRLTTNPAGVFREVQNANQARNYGAEVELTMTPLEGFVPESVEGLRINLRGGWLETSFVEFTVAEQRQFSSGNIGVSIDFSGNPLISAPNLQASAMFTWPLLIPNFGTLTPQYDFTWTGDIPFDPNQGRGESSALGEDRFSPYTIGNRAYMLHNVRLSWSPPNQPGIEFSGWCRNVTDERYKTFAVDVSTFSGQQLIFVADPRTCGADFRFNW